MTNNGAIAAGSVQTANAGKTILNLGGNAVDAAVAAAFTSFVAEPALVHLGGSGLAQVYDGSTGQSVVYDFFSNMPGLKDDNDRQRRTTLDFKKIVVDFGSTTQDFHVGRGSVAVPGNIFGLCTLHREMGTLSLGEILQPAIELAESGFQLSKFHAYTMSLLKAILTSTDSIKRLTMPNGSFLEEGDFIQNVALADTYRELASSGEKMIRSGPFASRFVADQKKKGGLVTQQDLACYNVMRIQPIKVNYRDHVILLPPPSSSGGILIAFALKLLSRFDVAQFQHGSTDHLQLLAEVMAATGRARPHWEEGRKHFSITEAQRRFLNDRFIGDFANETMGALVEGQPSRSPDESIGPSNTSHISVIDGDNLAVSLTTTAGESAGYVVPGSGFIPNNMLGEEDLFPNGFHNMPAGERIFTMMTPTIVLKEGQPKLILGSGGSSRIRSAILQVICNAIDFDMPITDAVHASRIHLESGKLQCEAGFMPETLEELADLGYQVNAWPEKNMYFGGAHCVSLSPDGDHQPVGDPRREGATA